MPSKLIPYAQNRICLNLPEISSDKWSDFRREYEQGKTLKQIALEYHCDPRTVRKCLFLNHGSNDIGKQHCTKKLTAYLPMIDELYRKYTGIDGSEASSPDTDGKVVVANHPSSFRGSRGKEYGICKHYKEASESIMKNGLPAFPEKDTFYQLLDGLLSTGEPLYESTFDAFLNTHYGAITDKYPEM